MSLEGSEKYDKKFLIFKVKRKTIEERGCVYVATHWSWRLKEPPLDVYPYAVCVSEGLIRGVFKIVGWSKNEATNRISFDGKLINDAEAKDILRKRITEKYRKRRNPATRSDESLRVFLKEMGVLL